VIFTIAGVLCIALGVGYYCYLHCSCCQCCRPPAMYHSHQQPQPQQQQQQPPSGMFDNVMAYADDSRPI
jgi:hypothetical protein